MGDTEKKQEVPVTVKLDKEMVDQLDELAEREDRSRSKQVKVLLKKALEEKEG